MSKKATELSREGKLWVVREYLDGKGSTYSLGEKYGVTNTTIRRWVDEYETNGEHAFQRKRSVPTSLSVDEKLRAVHEYLDENISLRELTRKYDVGSTSIRKWIAKYKYGGDAAFLPHRTKKHYSNAFKQEVVQAYLNGEGSLSELSIRFKIPSFDTVRKWIMKYNGCKYTQTSDMGGAAIMKQGRKTTYEERVQIVSFCMENNKDYQLTTERYQVSYQQIYSWVRKYESQGVEGLLDQRGRTKPESEMTELEKLRAENRLLKAQNKRQEMEMNFLKKLDEIERRRG